MMLLSRAPQRAEVLLIRPGSTEFDEQGRIKGSLDIPLSKSGKREVASMASELSNLNVGVIYASPCRSAQQTAKRLAEGRDVRVKTIECLRNIDHGLWHGKLIEEVRRNQPRVYRAGQESPDDFCPPEGEPISMAKERVRKGIRKLLRRPGGCVIAMIVPDPLATLVESCLRGEQLSNLWQAETRAADWTLIETTTA
ncbi:histidine phosphatase family protein [Crateriforma conspicua]|uniref:Phosphoserine phosphatase 1 n=1 Tax=Crateriforma conspicua TaxID=2527996 RepID=A0A5C5Y7M5_9PLAN|nr:histidine phosphatase family protein [Crateriforma conspicua]QDV62154.1 Phosphoserine phosphatase 1 [Crateriforma conspicua]TWT71677.1 Phosphoserine phosphatase 1 [Crateriforma conspicua]